MAAPVIADTMPEFTQLKYRSNIRLSRARRCKTERERAASFIDTPEPSHYTGPANLNLINESLNMPLMSDKYPYRLSNTRLIFDETF